MERDIDLVTLEVVKNALGSLGDEMALVIMRSAYSPVVRDSMDYSTALCDRHGRIVAQGLTLAVQLGAFPEIMAHIIADYGDDMYPGDVFIANDPYGAGGQHLPDIYIIKPIFAGGSLEGYAATMAHHSDVGGIAPGSVAIHATEVFQEGLRLPLLKLYEGGRPNRAIFSIIERNSRNPVHVMGDLRAQLAACDVGEKGLVRLIEKYGAEVLHPYFDELQDQAERMMLAEIAAIPDGEYHYRDYIDGYGETRRPLTIAVTVRIAGESIVLDFTGTSAQVPAAINCPIAMAKSAAYCAIRCIGGAEIPNCEGYMRAVTFEAPLGTILNPVLPAACGARGVMGYRVFDAIMGALAQVVPDKVIAAGEGGPTLFSLGGYVNGAPFTLTEVMVGTWGARAGRDGIEGISNPAANLSNQPVELIEAELPLQVVRYGLVADSGGAGKFRGGLAFVREFKLLSGEVSYTVRADRRDHPPYGLRGGKPGGASSNYAGREGVEHDLPTMPMAALPMKAGDSFRHVSAGGGGFGSPLERDPERVLADVRDDKVSLAAAREAYGVIIETETLRLDIAATEARRAGMAAGSEG
jgi:N-methylhydantoinase B